MRNSYNPWKKLQNVSRFTRATLRSTKMNNFDNVFWTLESHFLL